MANAIRFPIECSQFDFFGTDFSKSEEVGMNNPVLEFVFDENILSPTIESAIFN